MGRSVSRQPAPPRSPKASSLQSAAPPAAAPRWRRCPRSLLCICFTFFFFYVKWVIIAAIWRSSDHVRLLEQRDAMVKRGDLLAVPPHSRGIAWRVRDTFLTIFTDLPAFLVGYRAERAVMYSALASMSKYAPTPFRSGFAVFDHSGVSGVLSSVDQPRGVFLGAEPVPTRCMAP